MAGKSRAVGLRELANTYLPEGAPASRLHAHIALLPTALSTVPTGNPEVGFACAGDVGVWVKRVNTLLRDKAGGVRQAAAAALSASLPYCADDTFATHGVAWASAATTLLLRDGEPTGVAAIGVLRETARRSRLQPELRRTHASDVLPNALSAYLSLLKAASGRFGASGAAGGGKGGGAKGRAAPSEPFLVDVLGAVAAAARHYPGPTRVASEKLRNAIRPLLEAEDTGVAAAAAATIAALPLSAAAASQSEVWGEVFSGCLRSLHATVAGLYHDADERELWGSASTSAPTSGVLDVTAGTHAMAVDNETATDAPSEATDTAVEEGELQGGDEALIQIAGLLQRFEAEVAVLTELLQQPASNPVPVPLEAILGLSLRVLETGADTVGTSRHAALLRPLLPRLHSLSVGVAAAAVKAGRAVVRRYATLVLQIATTALGSPVAAVAARGYTLVGHLLQEAGASVIPSALGGVIAAAVAAATPDDGPDMFDRPIVRGSQLAGGSRAPPTPAGHADRAVLCEAGLRALQAVVGVCGAELRAETRDRIDGLLLATALDCGSNPPAPYSNEGCRLALYHALRTSVVTVAPGQPTMLPHTIALVQSLLHDECPAVRAFARESVGIFDQMVRPRMPSFRRKAVLAPGSPAGSGSQGGGTKAGGGQGGGLGSRRDAGQRGESSWGLLTSMSAGMATAITGSASLHGLRSANPERTGAGDSRNAAATAQAASEGASAAMAVDPPSSTSRAGTTQGLPPGPSVTAHSAGAHDGATLSAPASGGRAKEPNPAATRTAVADTTPALGSQQGGVAGASVAEAATASAPAKRKWTEEEDPTATTTRGPPAVQPTAGTATSAGDAGAGGAKQPRLEHRDSPQASAATVSTAAAAALDEDDDFELPAFPDDGPDSDEAE